MYLSLLHTASRSATPGHPSSGTPPVEIKFSSFPLMSHSRFGICGIEVDPHATSMITESLTAHEIRAGIIADTKAFLIGLESGATNEQLRAFLQRIREKELQLLKVGGNMLDPKIW